MIPIHTFSNPTIYKDTPSTIIKYRNPLLLITDHHNNSFLNLTTHYVLKKHGISHVANNISHEGHHIHRHRNDDNP